MNTPPKDTSRPTAGRRAWLQAGPRGGLVLAREAAACTGAPEGWYRVTAAPGSIPGPGAVVSLLPRDATGQDDAAARLCAAARPDGSFDALLVTSRATHSFLVAREDGAGDLDPACFSLEPISRPRAVLRLLAGMRAPGGRWDLRLAAGQAAAFALAVLRRRTGTGAARLLQRYRQCLAQAIPPGDGAGTEVRLDPDGLSRHPLHVPLDPLGQLQPRRAGDGGPHWQATGDDPQFELRTAALAGPLAGGWYEFACRMACTDGRLIAPCLYPDYGAGFEPESLLILPDPDADGWVRSLVLLKYDTVRLRFDPSIRRASFSLGEFSLKRIDRAGALARMFDGVRRQEGGGWARAASALADFARTARRSGLSAAGDGLYRAYLEARQQGATSYAAWVRLHDTLTESNLQALRREADGLAGGPRFSILLPLYETPEPWLRRCIDSVRQQAYRDWQLCIVDDASASPHVRRVVEEYQAADPRIQAHFRARNGHIAVATNDALAMATGEYVGLLDHDDELRPHALLEMAKALAARPGVRLLYSDEDKIDGTGRRFQPYFKPEWDPDLLLGQNYLCHFTVVETALVREVGGFRPGFEGSQDHDLVLRCTERLGPLQVHHVPKVLYHWRAIPGSTALERDAKDYAADAGARAVADHVRRGGQPGEVVQLENGHYRVRWGGPRPRVSVVIPTRDRVELLRPCVESLLATTRYPDIELLVVDNQSTDPETLDYLEALARDGRARVLRHDAPFNYSRINNSAVAQSTGEIVALVNNDIEFEDPDWLDEMASQAMRPGVGAVGAMLYYPDGSIQHAGVLLGLGGIANHAYIGQPRGYPGHGGRARVVQSLSAVTGACLVVRRQVYDEVGGLDERLTVAFNDVDFCLRVKAKGYRNLWTPFAQAMHRESASRGSEDSPAKRARFDSECAFMAARWGEVLDKDPAYNPNLSLEGFNFELAFPPRH